MTMQVGIYGGAGHTAKMVAAELRDRGFAPVLGGRNRSKLDAAARELNGQRFARLISSVATNCVPS